MLNFRIYIKQRSIIYQKQIKIVDRFIDFFVAITDVRRKWSDSKVKLYRDIKNEICIKNIALAKDDASYSIQKDKVHKKRNMSALLYRI